eukprot:7390526-Prymnesium_polylepis.1
MSSRMSHIACPRSGRAREAVVPAPLELRLAAACADRNRGATHRWSMLSAFSVSLAPSRPARALAFVPHRARSYRCSCT